MLRYFKEHPVFDEFTCFDPKTGRLSAISDQEFGRIMTLPKNRDYQTENEIERYDGSDFTVFTGKTNEWSSRFPRRVYFQITRQCNLSCAYCFIKADRKLSHIPTSDVLHVISYLGKNGLIEVRLTGGEPTTHPDFLAIVDTCQNNGIYVSVATNGLMSRDILEELAIRKNLWLICSLDGDRDIHNHYRPDSFDKVITNLKYLKTLNPDIRLRLTTVLTKQNADKIRFIAGMVRELNAESATFIPLRPQFRTRSMLKEMLTNIEFKFAIDEMIRFMEQYGVQLTTTLAMDNESRIFRDPVARKKGACAAGREALNLDYDASKGKFVVYGCSYSPASDLGAPPVLRKPFIAGEFSSDDIQSFYKIWRNDQYWSIFRDHSFKSNTCKKCNYFKNNQCIGSCPIQNIDYHSIDERVDTLLQLKEQLTHTAEWYCYKNIYEGTTSRPASDL